MKVGAALEALRQSELDLARRLREVAERQAAEVDVHHLAKALAEQCDRHAERLEPFVGRYADGGGGTSSLETYASCTWPPRT